MPGSDTHKASERRRRRTRRPAYLPQGGLLTYRRPLIVLAHVVAFAVAMLVSFLVANHMGFDRDWLVEQYPLLLAASLVVKLAVFGGFGQYRGWWRYVGISDLLDIFTASLVSTIVLMGLWYAEAQHRGPSAQSSRGPHTGQPGRVRRGPVRDHHDPGRPSHGDPTVP